MSKINLVFYDINNIVIMEDELESFEVNIQVI